MAGLTVRRFVLQNITAVIAHGPSSLLASAAMAVARGEPPSSSGTSEAAPSTTERGFRWLLVGGRPGAASAYSSLPLVTEAEIEWIRKRRAEEAEDSRVVLATRPSCSLLRGVAGGALNFVLGFVVSPLVLLSVTLEKLRLSQGPGTLCAAPLHGVVWGFVFFVCAEYAAVQQVLACFYFQCLAVPLYYSVNRRPVAAITAVSNADAAHHARAWIWNGLRCRFEAPQGTLGAHHPLLAYFDDSTVLRERAMKRLSRGERNKQRNSAKYSGRTDGDGIADDDYYGMLGVPANATARQIKEAYNRKALHIHPDRNSSPHAAQDFDRITKAYRILSNPKKRKMFDLGGAKGVEDTGAKKRDAVRTLFGGEEMRNMAGDVFTGSFSQRVIDGLDFTAEELAVLRQRMYEQCREELLQTYLAHCSAVNDGPAASTLQKAEVLATQLRKLLRAGLAKEVLYTIGHEYKRVITYFDLEKNVDRSSKGGSEAVPNVSGGLDGFLIPLVVKRILFYVRDVRPHRWQVQRQKWKLLARVRGNTFKDSAAMVDLAWYTSVQEFELTARTVALMILYDPSLDPSDVMRRRDALEVLADVFIAHGQPYKGASRATMDQLMNSMREYQQQREREKHAQ